MQVLKWSDYCLPLARYRGQPFRAVAQASVDNFTRLGVAFIEDRLHLDSGLMPSKIVRMLLLFYMYSFSFIVYVLLNTLIMGNIFFAIFSTLLNHQFSFN